MRSLVGPALTRLRFVMSRTGAERGDGPVQAAILAPMVIALSLLMVQGGIYYHARTIAVNAAQVGVESSRAYNSSAGAGQAAAQSYLGTTGSSAFSTVNISSSRSATTATVTVSARTASMLPGVSLPMINARAQAPVERLTSP